MSVIELTFNIIEYHGYPIMKTNYRVSLPRPSGNIHIFESDTWAGIFALIDNMYPGIEYAMPDEIFTIKYNYKGNKIESN